MAIKTNVLAKFNIPSSSLGNIYTKADEYARQLYKYYTGEEVDDNDKYWKSELRDRILKTNSRKYGRYVPGKTVKKSLDKKSDDIINEISNHIMGYLSRNENLLDTMAFNSLEDIQTALNNFGNIKGVKQLTKQIDTQSFGKINIPPEGVLGLQLELQKTLERYLTLKPGEVIVNTNNYNSGSPIYDIEVIGTDGTKIMSEVKNNLSRFRILGINTPFKTAPGFVKTLIQGCKINSDAKKIILSKDSIMKASTDLLKDHFGTVQPFFESESAIKLFTDLFLEDKKEKYLPISAEDDEDNLIIGSIESVEMNEEGNVNNIDVVERYIKKKMTRYMLWYGK